MIKKKFVTLVAAMLAMVGNVAVAESFVCDWNKMPVLSIVQSSGVDTGTPGLVFVAVRSPDQKLAAFLGQNGEWLPFEGGLFPPARIYINGLPGTVSIPIGSPNGTSTMYNYVGWEVYVGTGALTASSQNIVRQRRQALDRAKPVLTAKGQWNPAFDDDERIKWSLVQKDMLDGIKYRFVTVVPALSCDSSGS